MISSMVLVNIFMIMGDTYEGDFLNGEFHVSGKYYLKMEFVS